MSPATEWSLVALQSVRGGLSNLSRRVAHLEARSAPGPDQPRHSDEADHFFDAVLDALDTFNTGHHVVFQRLEHHEEKGSEAPTPPARQGNDPLGLLFDALNSSNGELTDFAERLARLENAAFQVHPLPRSPRRARSSSAAAIVRAAQGRRMRKAVSRA
ncbi:hypothetical protein ACFY91_24745 [Streptomyces albogriseolus]|uniref:hypothetical protein n=1 Tax=Streptomyces albogriseolus TaxID=1887 RepID=UPI0036E0430A